MKHLTLIGCLLAGFAVAQTEEALVSYHYNVPFPGSKTVPTNSWNLLLELQSLQGDPYNVSVTQYDIRGREIDTHDFGTYTGGRVFRWSSETYRLNARVRSLAVTSLRPLTGTLWMWNDTFGQINAVSIGEDAADKLVIPHIPEDFYTMTTTFAVVGPGDVAPSDLLFAFADSNRIFHPPTRVRSNLPGNGYFIATPEWTLPIGTLGQDSNAVWGELSASNGDYVLSGYQTFTREADRMGAPANQTGAVSLAAGGVTDGWLLLSNDPDMAFENELIFTNPGLDSVDLSFEMLVRLPGETEEDPDQLIVQSDALTLAGYEKRIAILGEDVFAGLEGEPVWLRFNTVAPQPEEDTEEAPVAPAVYAIHMQNGGENAMMGSHRFAQAGNHIATWIGFDPEVDAVLELTSTGREIVIPVEADENGDIPEDEEPEIIREVSHYQIAFYDRDGQISLSNQSIEAGTVRRITPELLLDTFAEILGDGEQEPISIRIDVLSGPDLIAKTTAFGTHDIAILNPRTRHLVPEVEDEEPPPEE